MSADCIFDCSWYLASSAIVLRKFCSESTSFALLLRCSLWGGKYRCWSLRFSHRILWCFDWLGWLAARNPLLVCMVHLISKWNLVCMVVCKWNLVCMVVCKWNPVCMVVCKWNQGTQASINYLKQCVHMQSSTGMWTLKCVSVWSVFTTTDGVCAYVWSLFAAIDGARVSVWSSFATIGSGGHHTWFWCHHWRSMHVALCMVIICNRW